jgi:hypothetical protein
MKEIKTVNLKGDRPTVQIALQRLEREIAIARRENHSLLKIVHGYGSSGEGGDIRIAVQRRAQELVSAGEIRGRIFGEEWSKSSEDVWKLLQEHPELKSDKDLGRRNSGITVLLL